MSALVNRTIIQASLDDHPTFPFSFYILLCLLIFKLSKLSAIQLAAAVNSPIKRLIYNDREKDQRDPPDKVSSASLKSCLALSIWPDGDLE
jgi:hypothetical protein